MATPTKFLTDAKGYPIGYVVYRPSAPGWFFIPHTTARSPSRKPHATPEAAIPVWARKLGGTLSDAMVSA